jgi:hypothetical protein
MQIGVRSSAGCCSEAINVAAAPSEATAGLIADSESVDSQRTCLAHIALEQFPEAKATYRCC